MLSGSSARNVAKRTIRSHVLLTNNARRRAVAAPRYRGVFFSSSTSTVSRGDNEGQIKISYVLSTLMVFGLGATAWGLYEFYTTLTQWPKEVKGDLRSALKAKQNGDLNLSARHLERAWNNLQNMPLSSLEPNPLRKLTGVAILYAEVLESSGQPSQAFDILSIAVKRIRSPDDSSHKAQQPEAQKPTNAIEQSSRSQEHHEYKRFSIAKLLSSTRLSSDEASTDVELGKRAIAMSLKLGALAEKLGRVRDEEYWLSFSVTESLRILQAEYGLTHNLGRGFFYPAGDEKASSGSPAPQPNVRDMLQTEDSELGLPAWASITKTELAAPMERLAAFYGRQGKTGNAVVLYRVASSLLTRKKNGTPTTAQEYCQALQVENAHMAVMMDLHRNHPDDEVIAGDIPRIITRAWKLHSSAEAANGQGITGPTNDGQALALCDETFPAVLFNVGIYHEEEGQLHEALEEFSVAYALLRKRGPREQAQWAYESMRRVKRLIEDQKASQNQAAATSNNSAADQI